MEGKIEYITDLRQIMSQCYYQVLVGADREDKLFYPESFGSAILYLFQGHIFLITAEHVVSPANFSFKLDKEKNYIGAIPTNRITYTEQGQPIGESVYFYINREDFTKYFNLDKEKYTIVFERLDFYYTQIENNPQFKGKKFITQGQQSNDGTIRYGNLNKVCLNEKNVTKADLEKRYAIFGIVNPNLDNLKLVGNYIYHCDMAFMKEEKQHLFFEISKSDEHLKSEDWRGLSGAAVFDQTDGRIVGIATHYDSEQCILEVVSMEQINLVLDSYLKSIKSDETREIESYS